MNKEINPMTPKYVVFAELEGSMLQEALVQQSNPLDTLEQAREYAARQIGTCYIFQQIEQHYVKPNNI